MRIVPFILPPLLALSSCTSPPKPPSVDPSLKRPANAAAAIELQVCKGELQNTRIVASEATHLAESANVTANRVALLQRALAARSAAPQAQGNAIYTVLFAFGSTEVNVPELAAASLAEQARRAALILMRGRTDGDVETAAESRIARARASAVRAYLVQAGVDPSRIRTTYQPVGDNTADNGSPAGRALNRRVEIELYSVVPRVLVLNIEPQL
jgi:outer membrane protein OmpA-like peptidoglycan-associated protein